MEPISQMLLELLDDAVAAGVIRVSSTPRAALLVKQVAMFSWFRDRVIKDPELQITAGDDHRPPRVHDLRHTFAVHRLLRWYR